MKNSKSQTPNPKKIPNTKFQITDWEMDSSEWNAEQPLNNGAMILRECPTQGNGKPFDLEERTAQFGEAIVRFCKRVPRSPANDRLAGQLAGCGTSVGANYHEANEPVSKKDFRHCISRCLKEAKETKFF